MLIYATGPDLVDWLRTPDVPDNTPEQLRKASLLVRRDTRTARYDVDSSGKPSDPDLLAAMRDACCAQVEAWIAAGVNPAGAGLSESALVSSETRTLGPRSQTVTYNNTLSQSVTAFDQRAYLADNLCEAAVEILTQAGLIGQRVCVY